MDEYCFKLLLAWAMEELKECMAVVVAITNQIIC